MYVLENSQAKQGVFTQTGPVAPAVAFSQEEGEAGFDGDRGSASTATILCRQRCDFLWSMSTGALTGWNLLLISPDSSLNKVRSGSSSKFKS